MELAFIFAIVVSLLLLSVLSTVGLAFYITKRRSPFTISTISSSLEEAGVKIGQLASPKKKKKKKKRRRREGVDPLGLHPLEPILYEGNTPALTTTVRAAAHTPSGSQSSTFTCSRLSRKTRHTSHTTSIITLPVDFIHSSPLRLNSVTAESVGQFPTSPRQGTNRYRRWEVDSIHSRASTANSELGAELTRMSSPTSLFPAPPVSSHPPQLDSPTRDFRASFMSVLPYIDSDDQVRMRPGPIIKKPVSCYHAQELSPSTEEHINLNPTPHIHRRGDRPFFGGAVPQRTLSKRTAEPASVVNRLRGDSVKRKRDSRVLSALRDWGTAVFMEIDKTLEDARSVTASPDKEYQSSRLSSASNSTYSLHDGYNREATRKELLYTSSNNKSSNTLPKTGVVEFGSVGKAKETIVIKAPRRPTDPSPLDRANPAKTNPFEPDQGGEESTMRLPSEDALSQVSKSHSQRSRPEVQQQQSPRPPSPPDSPQPPTPRFSQRYTRRFETAVQ
ncbi:hypothetical protein MMC30_001885 [Trapelia coarctata]|nr:hypothetical protein [Trapelia coarctata]